MVIFSIHNISLILGKNLMENIEDMKYLKIWIWKLEIWTWFVVENLILMSPTPEWYQPHARCTILDWNVKLISKRTPVPHHWHARVIHATPVWSNKHARWMLLFQSILIRFNTHARVYAWTRPCDWFNARVPVSTRPLYCAENR